MEERIPVLLHKSHVDWVRETEDSMSCFVKSFDPEVHVSVVKIVLRVDYLSWHLDRDLGSLV